MDRKTFTIILAVVLIGCFFLPYYSGFIGKISGVDMVKGQGDWQKYIWLLIPLSGALLLIGAINGNYVLGRGLLSWLPLLTLLYFLIIYPLIKKVPIGDIFKELGKGYGTGLWITIVASVILAFYNPRPK